MYTKKAQSNVEDQDKQKILIVGMECLNKANKREKRADEIQKILIVGMVCLNKANKREKRADEIHNTYIYLTNYKKGVLDLW